MPFLSWPIDGKTVVVSILMIVVYLALIWAHERE